MLFANRRKKILHVNKNIIASNKKHSLKDPPVTVRMGKEIHRGHEAEIDGPSRLVYRPDKPLSCGARVWIETTAFVRLA
jgi:hypothetical protein